MSWDVGPADKEDDCTMESAFTAPGCSVPESSPYMALNGMQCPPPQAVRKRDYKLLLLSLVWFQEPFPHQERE